MVRARAQLLYFYPRALPSTFESAEGRDKRQTSIARMRTAAALQLLMTLEEQAAGKGKKALAAARYCEMAEQLLRAGSTKRALAYVQGCAQEPTDDEASHKALAKIATREAKRGAKARGARQVRVGKVTGAGKVALNGLSQPALKAGCKLIGVSGPQPGPMRRGALGRHLEQLIEEDRVLIAQVS